MQEYSFLLAIAGVLAAGAMSPGPSFFVVAQNALSRSRADGLATAVGTALGVALFAILAGFGVVALLEQMPKVYLVLKIVGGVYLLWIASKIWRGATQSLTDSEGIQENPVTGMEGGPWRSFMQGLIVQTSNPKTAIVIAGIFAAFVPATPPPFTVSLVTVTAFIIDFSWYAIVAITLSNAHSRRIYDKAKPTFDRAAALFLVLVALRLILGEAL
ncbi:MAG TPA: threonine transporter [Gammaproteobacteria bacterium]|mgnify:CR=1 FL=1|jgi:threonine/homoserine/homoserine lactone efflux protein|nr:threonine transporter [Gammaproteobacteria bacterium]